MITNADTTCTFTWRCPLGCLPVQLTIPIHDARPFSSDGQTVLLESAELDEDHLQAAMAAHFAGNHQGDV